MRTIARDPFARQNTIRETVKTSETCAFCGSSRDGKLYRYGISPDEGRNTWAKGLFCSIACFRDYFGV